MVERPERFLILFVTIAVVFIVVDAKPPNTAALRTKIQDIYATLQKEQVQKSQPFSPFPFQWQEDKGLYRSYIHVDATGDWEADLIRNYFQIPDSNMFVTAFVVSAILEAHGLGTLKADAQSLQVIISSN